jgi:hypothetical protein
MIVALAGRRIDGPDAPDHRFPEENIELVRGRVLEILKTLAASAVVCSAACGADLIALSSARSLGLRIRVVLPFDRERFRATSVTDRPGDWGPIYDQILDEAAASGDLVFIPETLDAEAYAAANQAIFDEAISLARELNQPVTAVLVWDCAKSGPHDMTEEFGIEAVKRGVKMQEVKTIR